MKTNNLNVINKFVLGFLIAFTFACAKPNGEVSISAQNIYQLPSGNWWNLKWYLANQEFGAFTLGLDKSIFFNLNKFGFDFSKKKFTNQLVEQYFRDSQTTKLPFVFESKVLQLDEIRFLHIKIVSDKFSPSSSIDFYYKVYLTNSTLNSAVLLSDLDSSYDVSSASVNSDNKIILVGQKNDYSRTKVTCINGLKTEWVRFIALDFQNSNLKVTDQNIYMLIHSLSYNDLSYPDNRIVCYDFTGKLIKTNFLSTYNGSYTFHSISFINSNIVLLGEKYNELNRSADLCFLTMDKSFNILKEKVLPYKTFIEDYDNSSNKYGSSKVVLDPIVLGLNFWLPVRYFDTKFGESLKLIKMGSTFNIEFVKPIFTNINPNLNNVNGTNFNIRYVGFKTDNQYLYLGGLNYKGYFFYRLNQNGDFK